MTIINISDRIKLIDLYDLNQPYRTGSYVILEENITLIETSASPSIPYLKQGLSTLNIDLNKVKYIILTHIHLDHGGGIGLFIQDCPNASVIVHPKGERHLIDPSKLEQSARTVYKDQFDALFNPILPVPSEKIITKKHGETLKISDNTTLTFYDSPGHSKHHFSIYDPVSNGMFTGDTAGIYYYSLKKLGIDFFLPSTSPNQFDPEAMLESLRLYKQKSLDVLYFGHFGFTKDVNSALKSIEDWIPVFLDCSKRAYESRKDNIERFELTFSLLQEIIYKELKKQEVSSDNPIYSTVDLDLKVSAMGLIDYWHRNTNRQ